MRAIVFRPLAITFLLTVPLLPVVAQSAAPATEPPTAAQQSAPSQPTQAHGNRGVFIDSKTASSQNLAKAEEEDDEYVFRHSASVRAFARIFHLSPNGASMAFWALNAIILFVFIGYFLVTGLPKAFRSRRQQLDKQIVEARSAAISPSSRDNRSSTARSRASAFSVAVRASTICLSNCCRRLRKALGRPVTRK